MKDYKVSYTKCKVDSCERAIQAGSARGWCRTHYRRWRLYGDPLSGNKFINRPRELCVLCESRAVKQDFCEEHYSLWKKSAVEWIEKQPAYRYLKPDGYVYLFKPNHQNSTRQGYVHEHRFVMSEYLGRPLNADEIVHHKNGNRSDNKIENLELWNKGHPSGQRIEDLVTWAESILKRYKNYETP